MSAIFRKEILHLLGNLTAYLAAGFFLSLSGVLTWFFKDNILDNAFADLQLFFNFCPYLLLFLIPALSMQVFAEEKKQGTLEKIYTFPITLSTLVIAKFLAVWCLVLFCLLPTTVYFYTIYQLAYPLGNVDFGAYFGSFLGLIGLATVFVAIGLFSSALTRNQISAFLTSVFLSFIFWIGWDEVAYYFQTYQDLFLTFSLKENYLALSKGALQSRELLYFAFLTLFFLWLTRWFLYFFR